MKKELTKLRKEKKITHVEVEGFVFNPNISKEIEETLDTSIDQTLVKVLYNTVSQKKL